MNKKGFINLSTFLFLFLFSTLKAQTYTLKFKTNYGNFEAVLYDFTPNHRDLILKEIENKTYKNAQFNRVIKNFVIQGGELDDSILKRENENKEEKKRLAPEFHPKAFHHIGALGAGRDDNPHKGSFFNQIYFVVGKKVNDLDLDLFEEKKNIKFTKEQRAKYIKEGGLPRLDQDYTIFGKITKGLDVALKISEVDTDHQDFPDDPVRFSIHVKKNKVNIPKTTISLGSSFIQ